MTKNLAKVKAIALIGVGIASIGLPSYAAWQECITDGGYHDIEITGQQECGISITVVPSDPLESDFQYFGTCYAIQRPKGYYCANGGDHTKCENEDEYGNPLQDERHILRYNARCGGEITRIPAQGDQPAMWRARTVCKPGDYSYESSETTLVGDCQTTYPEE